MQETTHPMQTITQSHNRHIDDPPFNQLRICMCVTTMVCESRPASNACLKTSVDGIADVTAVLANLAVAADLNAWGSVGSLFTSENDTVSSPSSDEHVPKGEVFFHFALILGANTRQYSWAKSPSTSVFFVPVGPGDRHSRVNTKGWASFRLDASAVCGPFVPLRPLLWPTTQRVLKREGIWRAIWFSRPLCGRQHTEFSPEGYQQHYLAFCI